METASSVPPFIPGLLIVGLLIILSIIIGWRNYVRRGDRRVIPGMDDWVFWDEVEGGRPERPKFWEVNVVDSKEVFEQDGEVWQQIMPLCATSLPAEHSNRPDDYLDPEPPRTHTTNVSLLNPHIPRLNFLSSSPPRSVPPSMPPHRLQVSLLITMPSVHHPRYHQLHANECEKSAEGFIGRPSLTETSRYSVSSSLWKEKLPIDTEDADAGPEVALGVAVLPWQKEGTVECTNVSTLS